LTPPHAVSAWEEAQVKWHLSDLIIAVLLTVLDGIVTVYFGESCWIALAGDLPACGFLVIFAVLEATSLANIWAQVVSGLRVLSESQYARPSRNVMPIAAEERGQSDV
jgi:hypothetical protein